MNTTPDIAFPVGYFVGSGIAGLAGLGCLVCMIMVLIPLFKEKGPGLGILGIFCGIFTYVWGWMNIKQHNLKKIMMIWTACFVVVLIGYAIMTAAIVKMGITNPDAFDNPSSGVPFGNPPLETPVIPETAPGVQETP